MRRKSFQWKKTQGGCAKRLVEILIKEILDGLVSEFLYDMLHDIKTHITVCVIIWRANWLFAYACLDDPMPQTVFHRFGGEQSLRYRKWILRTFRGAII